MSDRGPATSFMCTYSLPKTNEISFNTQLLVMAYYVYMYSNTSANE